jgi:hypothetical protein
MKKTATGFSPLIRVDRKLGKRFYLQVYDAFREAIVNHGLRAGDRIPFQLGARCGIGDFENTDS